MPEEPYNPIRPANWDSPMYNGSARPEPTWERLNSPSSRVMVTNTHEAQLHVVIDKFNVPHELKPGERREMELLNEEIAHFQEMRLPDRFYPAGSNTPGLPKPLHAIKIEGVPSLIEEQRAARDARQAEAAAVRAAEEQEQQRKKRGAGGRFA
jgi:hypothetical protein